MARTVSLNANKREAEMAEHIMDDPKGKVSATRVVFVIWGLGVLAVWILISIVEMKMQVLDNSIIYVLGIFMTGKVGQRFAENP